MRTIFFFLLIALFQGNAVGSYGQDGKATVTALNRASSKTGLAYEMRSRDITVLPAQLAGKEQGIVITGTVTDESGEAIPGVNVLVQGTTVGVITGYDGKYSIAVPDRAAVLVFSFMGYTAQEVMVGNRAGIDVVLNEDVREIEEVVVVGYGTQKKVNLTGAVSQITAEDMKDRPITKMTQALQGVIPNLNITFGSGQPGTSGSLNIRGMTSINGGSPLVLIDGVPGNIDRINVNDVATISVLKDASASAIYGARAAFGVILVTTKNPKEGKTQVTYRNNFGWTTHATKTDFITEGYVNARLNDDAFYRWNASHLFRYTDEDWAEMEARRGDKTEHPDRPWVVVKQAGGRDRYNYYGNFDWYNYFYAKYRPKQSHDLSISGSGGNVRYLVSGNYSREQGIFRLAPDVDNRYNFRTKIDADVAKWLNISSNTRYFKSDYHWSGFNQSYTPSSDNLIGSSDPQFYVPYYHYHPQYVPFNPDGSLTGNSEMSNYTMGFGLHAIQENGKSKGRSAYSEFSSTFQAVLKPAEGLTLTGNYTYMHDLFQRYYRSTKVMYSVYPGVMQNWSWAALNTDQLTERSYTNDIHVINAFANYTKNIGRHNLNAMIGFNQELTLYKNIQASGTDLLSEVLNDLNLATGDSPNVAGGAIEFATRGAFGRINYDYAGKYLLEMSGRYDGTSRFPQKSRFGFFPSVSVGYRVSEEAFFAPAKQIVSNLKIRYSYGTLGNQDVDYYAYISSMGAGSSSWTQNGSFVKRVTLPAPVAGDLTWESATTSNIGFDMDILDGRLSLTADLYTRDTKNMLTQGKKLAAVYGASEPRENAADLRTKGYEITLGWRDRFQLAEKPFRYGVNFVFSDATSKITKFDNPTNLLGSYRVGQELGEIWGYVYDGFFETDEEAQEYTRQINHTSVAPRGNSVAGLGAWSAGDIKIRNLNDDSMISGGAGTLDSPGDRKLIGNTTSRYSYGISLSASWNGMDIYALFQGIGKKDWYPSGEATMFWGPFSRPYSSFIPSGFMDQVWSEDHPDAYYPRLLGYIAANAELARPNTMYLQNVGYCKLRNLTVGYTLPHRLSGRIGVESLRIYASGENLFTWTGLKNKYIDPEETMVYSDARTYPMGKTYSFGIELSF
ncbi:MAG: TonB-dependent receptor [Bacteroidales bacterium]|nr:TonB-dependent receptor [Bacteroidales bacterium]